MPDNVTPATASRRTRRSTQKKGSEVNSQALSTPIAAANGRSLVGYNPVDPLALRALFMRPAYLASSAWLEHIPFAFWLVEAHRPRTVVELGTQLGTSYFAFCQAVERLGLDTRCFAVDTWKGDEHAGFYGDGVFENIRAYNDAHYSRFSRLVRSTFDEALGHFSDGSIDVLHIDGLHTAEAVKHDFESWLPKLSKRAVVLLHDSNVRERHFGVFKLVEELREAYPIFDFPHGHGLAVIGAGPEQNDVLGRLFKANNEEPAKLVVHEVFSRLGRGCADAYAAENQRERIRKLQTADKVQAARSGETGHLAERVKLLEELRAEVKGEVARLNARLERATDTVFELQRSTIERQQLLMEAQQEAQRHQQAAGAAREKIEAQETAIRELDAAVREYEALSGRIRQNLDRAEAERDRLRVERQMLSSKLSERVAEVATLRRRIQQRENAAELTRDTFLIAMKVFFDSFPRVPATNRSLKALAKQLEGAGIIDPSWYLAKYTDVAAAGMDPAIHYILFGIKEGRDPRQIAVSDNARVKTEHPA